MTSTIMNRVRREMRAWNAARAGRRDDSNSNLWGIVDMGSNGIRFSITDMSHPTARILPTLYMYRNSTSLYEAQYDDDGNHIPLSAETIDSVVGAFLRFEIFCEDFKVPFHHIRIIATEATRNAPNSEEFIRKIHDETGLKVELLSRAQEGITGAWGIASSASEVRGLVMDLGGGSVQITWIVMKDGNMQTSQKGAFSFPYGAAALTQRLAQIDKKSKSKEDAARAKKQLREEMKKNFLNAYNELDLPDDLVAHAKRDGGFPLYLSGGGFRGWGYLLLYESQIHHQAYPISIINGFIAGKKDFEDTNHLEKVARDADEIFRISDRRRAQVPAVAFLVNVLAEVIPHGISEAHFCQGGVREGILFSQLPAEVRMQSPIEVSTAPHARPLSGKLGRLLRHALPKYGDPAVSIHQNDIDDGWDELPSQKLMRKIPTSFSPNLINAFANMLYVHADMSKEQASTAALYSTTTGALAAVHGTSHKNRALLALLLEARYEGELPPREDNFRDALRSLLSPAEVWWVEYLGAVALVLSRVYPAGTNDDVGTNDSEQITYSYYSHMPHIPAYDNVLHGNATYRPHHKKPHLRLHAEFVDNLGKTHDKSGIKLVFTLRMRGHNRDDPDPMNVQQALEERVKDIHKVGKKENWYKPRQPKKGSGKADNDDDWEQMGVRDKKYSESGKKDDDEVDGWGMKVKVEVKVEYPWEKKPDEKPDSTRHASTERSVVVGRQKTTCNYLV